MPEKGNDGMAMPFGMPMPDVDVEIGQGTLEQLGPMLNIMRNLPLFAGCHADLIDFVNETGQVEAFRDFLKGRLCEKHREIAPPNIFESIPEVLGLFEERLEEYLDTLGLERCTGHEHE